MEHLRIGKQSIAALSSYGKAINYLAKALRDPIKVNEPYTLAAVFMIAICQVKEEFSKQSTYTIPTDINRIVAMAVAQG